MENFVCGRNETYTDIGETSTDHEYEVPIKKNEWIIMIEQGNIGCHRHAEKQQRDQNKGFFTRLMHVWLPYEVFWSEILTHNSYANY